jgi:hypothetical protein
MFEIGRYRRRVEGTVQAHAGTGEHRRVQRDEESVDMEDRQGVQEHILRGHPPQSSQRTRVGDEVGVAEHRALGSAGGA